MSPTSAADSLSALATKLSPSVYLSEPPQQVVTPRDGLPDVGTIPAREKRNTINANAISSQPPKIIVLCTWMSARPDHIAKYVLGYRTLYPTSRILVIRSSPPDLFYRRIRTQRRRTAPAISTILSSLSVSSQEPEIILHVFSNGGSHQTRNLLLGYGETTSQPFPPHITVFDSCPGRATFGRSVLALSSALPSLLPLRLLLLLLIYVVVGLYWVVFVPFGIPDPIERIRQALNDSNLMQTETKRCYIYSEIDPMVGWNDVEQHAIAAAEKGFTVQREKFEGSGHCAHVRVEGGARYWAIVDALWQARIKS